MLLKFGVDISRLDHSIRRKLKIIENVFYRNTGKEPVITSTYEGSHSLGSLHYQNKAIDLRREDMLTTVRIQLLKELKQHLGKDYDVIQETTHFHIEYDPKEKG